MIRHLLAPLVLRPLGKDRLRFALTVSGIAVGVATMAAIRLANASVLSSFSDTVDFVAGKASITILADGPGIPEETLERLAWLRGIGATLAPAISETAAAGAKDGEVVEVLGIDPLSDPSAREYSFAEEGEKKNFLEGEEGGVRRRGSRVAQRLFFRRRGSPAVRASRPLDAARRPPPAPPPALAF